MATVSQPATSSKVMFWLGWLLTILPAGMLIMSGTMKIVQPAEMKMGEQFEKLGYPAAALVPLGVVEIVCAALYLFPPTAVLGAILATGYLGGAVATHVRMSEPFIAPIIPGVLAWLALVLRDPRIRAVVPWRSKG